jgi:O-antigen ligase
MHQGVKNRQVWSSLWLIGPAMATVPALLLDPKWSMFYLAVVVVALPAAILIRDAKLWLFVIGAASAFNFTKVIGGHPRDGVMDPRLFELKVVDIPILALMAIAFYRASARDGEGVGLIPGARRALLVGVLFVAWILIGAISANRPDVALVQSIQYVRLMLALGFVAVCANSAERLRWGTAGLFLALGAQAAIAIAQYVAGSSFGLYAHFEEDTAIGLLTRSGGTLNPTVLSEYIGIIAPLVLANAFMARRRWISVALMALFCVAASASVLTLSRGGLLNLLLTTGIVVTAVSLHPDTSRQRKTLLVGATLLFAVALAGFFSRQAMARVSDFAADLDGEGSRLPQLKQALEMIVHNPLFGVGLGDYVETMGQHGPKLPYPVHNKFLLVTAETGIPGGLLYLALWTCVLVVFVRRARGGARSGRIYAVACAAAVIGTLINMNTDVYSTGGAPELALFLLAGLGFGAAGQRGAG